MNGNCYSSDGVNPTLTTNKGEGNKVAIPIGVIDDQGRLTKKVSPKDCAGTLRSESHGNQQKVVIPVLTPDRANKRQNGRRFKEDGDEAFTLTGQDRHGVAIEIEPLKLNGHNVSASGNEAHALNCTDQRKVFGAYQSRTMVGYNATLKRGGGTTQTAMTLNARDYKGLSGSNQMMTAAMMCLRSTRESDQKSERSQTALKQGKTEDCQNGNRKER